jgi:hypothetical protein
MNRTAFYLYHYQFIENIFQVHFFFRSLDLLLYMKIWFLFFSDMNSEANAALTEENKRLRQQMEEMRVREH